MALTTDEDSMVQLTISAGLYGSAPPLTHPDELDDAGASVVRAFMAARSAAYGESRARRTLNVSLQTHALGRRTSWSGKTLEEDPWLSAVAEVGPKVRAARFNDGFLVVEVTANDGTVSAGIRWTLPRVPIDVIEPGVAPIVEWMRRHGTTAGISSGFVTADVRPHPYETDVAWTLAPGATDHRIHVPGYYWAVLLQEPHIEALGGRRRVIDEAPVAVVEELGATTLLCRVTERPSELDLDALRPWREFLRPVLVPGVTVSKEGPVEANDRPLWLLEPRVPSKVTMARTEGHRTVPEEQCPPVELDGELRGVVTVRVPWATAPEAEEGTTWADILDAWALVGEIGAMVGGDGETFAHRGETTVTADGLEIDVDFGGVSAAAALERLSIVLGECAPALGTSGTDRFGVIRVLV